MIDDTLGDEVRVTVIAAGFDGGEPVTKKSGHRSNFVDAGDQPDAASAEAPSVAEDASRVAPSWQGEPELPAAHKDPVFDDDDDDLDIPDFLR